LISIECPNVVECERRLRSADPPVIARIENDRLIIDLRTVFPDEERALERALEESLRNAGG
jgi:L-seryl-tRNA(Ser) seleniumtransferase